MSEILSFRSIFKHNTNQTIEDKHIELSIRHNGDHNLPRE